MLTTNYELTYVFYSYINVISSNKYFELTSKDNIYTTSWQLEVEISDTENLEEGDLAYCWLEDQSYPGVFMFESGKLYIVCDINHPNTAGLVDIYVGINTDFE